MSLQNKNAVIYGAGGSIGGGVAREVAATLAFLASDDAMGITGTFINVTSMYPS